MNHIVFISYHHDSSVELVEHIVQALESHGIKCWYAPRDVTSKYAGDIEANTAAAIRYCRFAIEQGYMPIASHLLYPQILNDNDPDERELGLMFGIALLAKCNEVWCFGDEKSAGMLQEIKIALKLKKRLRFFSVEQEEYK